MAQVRYQVDGVPAYAIAAFMPAPGTTPAGRFSIRRFIHGAPGTMPVRSPKPAGAFRLSPSRQYSPPSEVAPDYFLPQLYVNEIAELPIGGGVSYLPKPVAAKVPPVVPQGALGPQGPARVAQSGRKVGGRRSMHWPRTIVRWPDLAGKY
jgi:hypothetical protein